MSYETQLRAEIHQKIDESIKANTRIVASWITHEICEDHRCGLSEIGVDSDYWQWCGYRTTREYVRRCISKRINDIPEDDDPQLKLDGFDHVQTHYLVKRGGEDIGVPIEEMTIDEIASKASHYKAMGAACFDHADELLRYIEVKQCMPLDLLEP